MYKITYFEVVDEPEFEVVDGLDVDIDVVVVVVVVEVVVVVVVVELPLGAVPQEEAAPKVVHGGRSIQVLEQVKNLAPKEELGGGVDGLQLGLDLFLVLELLQI